MNITEVIVGTRLELEIYDDYRENVVPAVTSQFEMALDPKTAIIAAPIFQGTFYPVRLGWYLKVYYCFKDDLYTFEAKVVSRLNKNDLNYLKIELLSDIIKIQRREFFRFECNVPVEYRAIDSIHTPEDERGMFKKAITRDLSGGGLCIKVQEEISTNQLIECKLELYKEKKVEFIGKIVRVSPKAEEKKYKYEIGVIFTQIVGRDKEAIIRFIFEEQRRLRKKGLI